MKVIVEKTNPEYSMEPPFHPHVRYPEYQFGSLSAKPNYAYDAVRNALHHLGLDKENFGTPRWNPLKELVEPNSTIVIKPNFVNHLNPLSNAPEYFQSLVTHSSVIRSLIDYVLLSGKENIDIVIADLPIQCADITKLHERSGLLEVINYFSLENYDNISFLDLRKYYLDTNEDGSVNRRLDLTGDGNGYVTIDLGQESSLVALESHAHLFQAPDYEGNDTVDCHNGGKHQYVLPKTILSADLFINVPKLKVHRKAGVTLSLKNLVGIIGDKSCLPHWRKGDPSNGGDEYAISTAIKQLQSEYDFKLRKMGFLVWRMVRPIGHCLRQMDNLFLKGKVEDSLREVRNGDWYGNDTIWRMIHDLNKIIIYADKDGKLCDSPQRKYMTIIDGIIAGEGEGPLRPVPFEAGLVVAGFDPVATDVVTTKLMGFDWRKIHKLNNYSARQKYAFGRFDGSTDALNVIYNGERLGFNDCPVVHRFKPATGWKGHIELDGE